TTGALEALLNAPRLDDRLYRCGDSVNACLFDEDGTSVRNARNELLLRELVCNLLPGHLRQLIEKHRALDRIHFLDDRRYLFVREGVQQNKRVVVRKYRCEPCGKLRRPTAEHDPLVFVG